MMRPDAKSKKVYLYAKLVDFRKSIDGLVELDIKEENALLHQRLFGRRCEQVADLETLQLALFNEAESVVESID